jgi:hypothetical protein
VSAALDALAAPPAFAWVPPYARTDGDLAENVGGWIGLHPDPNQRAIVDAALAENERRLPACFEVAVVAPRQNLKSAALHELACTWLFVMGVELIIWTAHLADTAEKAHEWLKRQIGKNPDLRAQCKWPPPSSNQDRAIELKTGERIEFHTRSGGKARGLTGDKVILDEALFLEPADMGALLPVMVTRPDAQVVYASSSGLLRSEVLRSIRDRGRAGGEDRLAYFEWSAPRVPCDAADACTHGLEVEGCRLDDRDLWRAANPAIPAGRITDEAIANQRRALPPAEFAREFLGWWDDPPNEGGAFDPEAWSSLADADAARGDAPAFGLAVAPDRSWAAIGVAWKRPDGAAQVMLADYRPTTTWVAERVEQLRATWGGSVLAPEEALDLADDPTKVPATEQRRAQAAFDDAVTARAVHHGNQPALNTAVRAAKWRKQGDGRVLDRTGSIDISPLVAVALARWALSTEAAPSEFFMI